MSQYLWLLQACNYPIQLYNSARTKLFNGLPSPLLAAHNYELKISKMIHYWRLNVFDHIISRCIVLWCDLIILYCIIWYRIVSYCVVWLVGWLMAGLGSLTWVSKTVAYQCTPIKPAFPTHTTDFAYCLCVYVYLKAYIDKSCLPGPALPETTVIDRWTNEETMKDYEANCAFPVEGTGRFSLQRCGTGRVPTAKSGRDPYWAVLRHTCLDSATPVEVLTPKRVPASLS